MQRMTWLDRKSTRLNSSDLVISYAVFCLKKKKYQEAMEDFEILYDPRWAARAQLGASRSTCTQFRCASDECWSQVCRFRIFFFLNHAAPTEFSPFPQRIAFPI